MAFNMTPEEIRALSLRCLNFLTRVPVAGLIIAAAAFASVLFMLLFRTAQRLWEHWLSHP